MQLLSPIGIALAFITVIAGSLLKGIGLQALWSTAAFVVVIVGTASAILIQTTESTLRRAVHMVLWVAKPPAQDAKLLITQVVSWSTLARRQGLLGLESQISSVPDTFAKKGLQLLVDGTEPNVIRDILEVELSTRQHSDTDAAKVFESAGVYAPTMGIIGAVLGLMAVLQNLSEPNKLGPGIAGAFVSTIYGIGCAYLLMLPIATKLKGIIRTQARLGEMLIEGLIAIAEGENPRNIEVKLQGFLH